MPQLGAIEVRKEDKFAPEDLMAYENSPIHSI